MSSKKDREALARVLYEHEWDDDACKCGLDTDGDHAGHQADAVLASDWLAAFTARGCTP